VPPVRQYLPAPPSQQILPLPTVASTPGSSHASAPVGAYYLYGGPIPSTALTSSIGFSGPSCSTSIPGAYALPSASAAQRGDVVTGTVSIDSFDAFILFDFGASFLFISKAFVDRMGISIQQIGQPITVNFAKGHISSNYVCPGCVIHLADEDSVWLIWWLYHWMYLTLFLGWIGFLNIKLSSHVL
jgi:hypothetical protein